MCWMELWHNALLMLRCQCTCIGISCLLYVRFSKSSIPLDWSLNRPYTPTGVAADIIINLVWGGKVRTDCIVTMATLLFT